MSFWPDLRYAARSLGRTPGFAAAAVLTLALGIGATSAIFTVVNAALLKPLPYPEPERVLVLGTGPNLSQPGQLFLHLRDRARAVEHVAAQRSTNGWNLVVGDQASYVTALQVSTAYFETLGIPPLLGRGFTDAETQANGPQAVIISESLWRRFYGGRPDAIGQSLELGGVTHTIVGAIPDRLRTIPGAEVWTPLRTSAADNTFNYRILARVADGSTLDAVRQEFDSLRPEIAQAFPRYNARRLAATTWTPLHTVLGSFVRTPLLVLLGAVGFVLLIACVNVAGLQLTRAIGRRRELAIRAALGGNRTRAARPVVAESALLALGGAAAGLAVAAAASRAMLGLVSGDAAQQMLSGETLALDWRVFSFTLGVALACSVLFGVVPALLATRIDLRTTLIDGATATPGSGTAWLRRSFATAEIALAVVLLVGAGLLMRTLANLTSTELGFSERNVVVGRMSMQGAARDGAELASALNRSLARIHTIAGVTHAAASNGVPIERPFNVVLDPPPGSPITEPRGVDWRYVTDEYFDLFGIRRLEGRLFDERDRAGSEPVAIVNEALARAYFGRVNVVGETIGIIPVFQDPPRRIVGVVDNVKARTGTDWTRGLTALDAGTAPMLFTPAGQGSRSLINWTHGAFAMTWSIRTDGPRPGLERDVQDALRAIDPRLPFVGFEPMSAVVSRDLDTQRLLATLLATFAGLAAVLAAIGLYGLMSYASSQRVREVGIRMAFGATAGRVLRHFMREGLAVAAAGIVLGAAGATFLTNTIAAYLFGVTPLDVSTYAAVVALLLITAATASLVPALRAARVNPMRALKTP